MARIMVTGCAGFIGFHVSKALLARHDEVLGCDNLCPHYDVTLKQARLAQLQEIPGFSFQQLEMADREATLRYFASTQPQAVIHLAALAGVRYAMECPELYVQSNLVAFGHVLDALVRHPVEHFVYASSSSVYGASTRQPFALDDPADTPLSLYAATKRANELMAYSYSHLHGLPATGLRFFTVYGPWGRPDMALYLFTERMLGGQPLTIFNFGHHKRDFTYIDDVVEAVLAVLALPPPAPPQEQLSRARHRVLNVASGHPVPIMECVRLLEGYLGRQATIELLPLQPGDVPETFGDISDLKALTGLTPQVSIEEGLARFTSWYRHYTSC